MGKVTVDGGFDLSALNGMGESWYMWMIEWKGGNEIVLYRIVVHCTVLHYVAVQMGGVGWNRHESLSFFPWSCGDLGVI